MGLVILGAVANHELSKADERKKVSPLAPEQEQGREDSFSELRNYVPADILDVSFPVSVRGYDRGAVDAYVRRVNRLIAELKVRSSPPAAVRHAVEQAGEKVQDLLQAAREAAEEITASAQQEAEESTARAKAESVELVVNSSAEADRVKVEADELIANARTEADDTVAKAKAEADERFQRLEEELAALREAAETRMREIQADTEAVWKQRRELLEDIRRMAGGLVDVADAAAVRFPRHEPAGPEEEMLEPEAGDETEPRGVAADAPAQAMPAVGTREGRDDESREG